MKQTKSTALYQTPFSKAYWRDAAMELKDIRILVFAALMIALRVALKSLGIPIAADLKINIAFFINALGAMVFGPVVAILAAAVSDTLGCLLFPTGVYFFPFIFIEIAGSLVFALFLYRTRVTATRVILSRFCVDFFVNIVLNAPIMAWYYQVVLNKSYAFFQLPRILKNLALFPLESVLLILFLMVMIPLAYRGPAAPEKAASHSVGRSVPLCRRLCGGIFCLRLQQQRPGVPVEHRGEGGGQHRPHRGRPGPGPH